MRRLIPTLTAILLMSVLVMAQTTPAPAPAPKPMPTPPPASGAMGDNSDMQATMSRIAADKALRMEMVHQLITVARTDSSFRHEMAGAIVGDKEMHAAVMRAQGSEKAAMKKHEGMMGTKPSEKKPAEPPKTTTPAPAPTPAPTPGK